MSSNIPNYKVVYDPELDPNPIKRSAKEIKVFENTKGNAKDPRPSKEGYERKSRLYKTQFIVVEFDKTNSTNITAREDNSKKTVLLSNILPLSTESQIITVLSVYGTVHRIEIIKDRATGGPLGYVKATFMEESSAESAVKNGNGRRVIISDSMKIEFDFTGEKLNAALSPVEKTSEIKQPDVNEKRPPAHRHSTGNTNDDLRIKKKPTRWTGPISGDNIQRSFSNYQDYRSNNVHRERSSIQPGERPYFKTIISRQNLPFMHGALEELERLFQPFGYIDIYHDAYDWFVIFDTKHAALQAQKYIHDNNPRIFGHTLDLFLPFNTSSSRPDTTGMTHPHENSVHKRPPPQQPQPQPVVLHSSMSTMTKQLLCNELVDIFMKDVKNRVARPFIYDFLNPYLASTNPPVPKKPDTASTTTTPETISLTDTTSSIAPVTALESDIQNKTVDANSIYKLPRFKKSTSFKPPTSQSLDLIKSVVQESIPTKKPISKDDKVDITSLIMPEKKMSIDNPVDTVDRKLYRRLSHESSDSSSEDDYLGSTKTFTTNNVTKSTVMKKKKKLKKKHAQFDSDSDIGNTIDVVEDDSNSEEDIEEAYRRITSKRRRPSKANSDTKRRKSSSSSQQSLGLTKKKTPVHMNMVIDETNNNKHSTAHVSTPITVDSPSTMDIDIDGDDDEHMAIDQAPVPKEQEYDQAEIEKILEDIDKEEEEIWSEPEDTIELNKEWDPFYLTKDVEDLEYMRIALMEKTELSDSHKISTALEKLERNEKRLAQSARTRGYYPIPDSIKATYLNKNKATYEVPVHPTSTGETSRSNRVNNRRLFVGMVMQNKAMADADILKFNQLKNRKKQLQFQKSPIHDWGLFSKEHIDANEMVIEYIGEVVRQQVALEREREYERSGIGSSYLFRVDEDTVIDATKKGSIARFINHCCVPNCSAKIITVEKQKKIVIYANRDIEAGEEITYDYKFPIEADKIPCLCGSKFCKGTLN